MVRNDYFLLGHRLLGLPLSFSLWDQTREMRYIPLRHSVKTHTLSSLLPSTNRAWFTFKRTDNPEFLRQKKLSLCPPKCPFPLSVDLHRVKQNRSGLKGDDQAARAFPFLLFSFTVTNAVYRRRWGTTKWDSLKRPSETQSHYSEPPRFVAFTGSQAGKGVIPVRYTGKGCVPGSSGDRISRRVDSEQDLNWVLFLCRGKQLWRDSWLLWIILLFATRLDWPVRWLVGLVGCLGG